MLHFLSVIQLGFTQKRIVFFLFLHRSYCFSWLLHKFRIENPRSPSIPLRNARVRKTIYSKCAQRRKKGNEKKVKTERSAPRSAWIRNWFKPPEKKTFLPTRPRRPMSTNEEREKEIQLRDPSLDFSTPHTLSSHSPVTHRGWKAKVKECDSTRPVCR